MEMKKKVFDWKKVRHAGNVLIEEYTNRGDFYFGEGEYDAAVDDYETALGIVLQIREETPMSMRTKLNTKADSLRKKRGVADAERIKMCG